MAFSLSACRRKCDLRLRGSVVRSEDVFPRRGNRGLYKTWLKFYITRISPLKWNGRKVGTLVGSFLQNLEIGQKLKKN